MRPLVLLEEPGQTTGFLYLYKPFPYLPYPHLSTLEKKRVMSYSFLFFSRVDKCVCFLFLWSSLTSVQPLYFGITRRSLLRSARATLVSRGALTKVNARRSLLWSVHSEICGTNYAFLTRMRLITEDSTNLNTIYYNYRYIYIVYSV